MNNELKEKMQQAAKEYASFPADAHIKKAKYIVESQSRDFIAGASAMYSELAPLVEWVSVEDRLPEEGELILWKNKYKLVSVVDEWNNSYKEFYHITHWRKIEL
ncbi:MAG: DUF551 domain-containing protein [Bacteroidales bacterium]|jgi:hypothetical protein|nr:DUF551 domain-containing protein [Bacteroidales bacterium]